MIYLDQFRLPSHGTEDLILDDHYDMYKCGYTDNAYPCNFFIKKQLTSLDFEPITILYGGNGSGKSTLLNLITSKLRLKRLAPFNNSNIFSLYVSHCKVKLGYDDDGEEVRIPNGSRIITSDDIFEYMLSVREVNKDISSNVNSTLNEYIRLRKTPMAQHLSGLSDYEEAYEAYRCKREKISARQYVYKKNGEEIRLNSNGETAIRFFCEKLKDDTLFLLDEPENSLSPKMQITLASIIGDMAKYSGCQFIIATHSPFILSIDGAKIYDLDTSPVMVRKWWELDNPKTYFNFFYSHKELFL